MLVVVSALLATVMLGACGSKTPAPPDNPDPAVQAGFRLVQSQSCAACHSVDGSKKSGPTLKGLAGSEVSLKGAGSVLADDAYLRLAITDPDAQIVGGYNKGVMSSVLKNNKELTSEQIDQIVAYIKTLQ